MENCGVSHLVVDDPNEPNMTEALVPSLVLDLIKELIKHGWAKEIVIDGEYLGRLGRNIGICKQTRLHEDFTMEKQHPVSRLRKL